MQQSVRVNPVGGINADVDPLYLNNGDYADGKNIRCITTAGSTTLSIEPVQGSTLSVTLPEVIEQNKKYKLEVDADKPYEISILITDVDGTFKSNLSYIFENSYTLADFKDVIRDALEIDLPGEFTFTHVSDNDNYFYIELKDHREYSITSDEHITVTQIQESLDGADETGRLQDIASFDMDGDLYIFSTVSDSDDGGYGEIGVQVYDADNDSFSYTRLLGSKELLFSTKHPLTKPDGQRTDLKDCLYFTDGTNPIRVFYYKGDFITDGAITYFNSDGIYGYGSIASESSLIQAIQNTALEVTDQIQTGGNLNAGNWRYSIRLLTEQLATTAFLPITNPIPVFSERTTGDILELKGEASDTVTAKINQITVSNIDTELFKYVELAGVLYQDSTQTAYIISRSIITGEEMILNHSGNENDTTDLDINELVLDYDVIDTAEHIAIIDNRLAAANVTVKVMPDFQVIADNISLTVGVHDLEGSGNVNYPDFIATGITHDHAFVLGEYQNPLNVVQFTGYTHYETYFVGIRFHLKNGAWSRTYAVGEIQIIPPSYNLTDDNYDHVVKVAYIQASSIDITSVRDEILGFSFVIADLEPEILATGVLLMSIDDVGTKVLNENFTRTTAQYDAEPTKDRKYGLFYSPDILNGNTSVGYRDGDRLVVMGSPGRPTPVYVTSNPTPPNDTVRLPEFSGYFGVSTTAEVHDLDDAVTVEFNGNTTVGGTPFHLQNFFYQGGLAIKSATDIGNPAGNINDDYGFYNCLYYRPLADKYNSPETLTYNNVGHYYEVQSNDSVIDNEAVFGGDTFTQGYYLHVRYNEDGVTTGNGRGVRFFSQNKGNMQLRHNGETGGSIFPPDVSGTTINEKIRFWLQDTVSEQLSYNKGYNVRNRAQLFTAFDANLEVVTKMGTRIPYSPLKPTNSTKDFFRTFLPLDFKDEELRDGEITGLMVVNGELFTLQPRAFRKQFFNTRGLVKSEDGTDILIGDGSVLAQKSQKISSYGCKHRFGWIIGRSQGGNDTIYWINTENGKMLRFGGDGTVALSDVQGLQSFLSNNTKWVDLYDNPLSEGGICGVWDNRYGEAIFTFRAKRTIAEYNPATAYSTGNYVSYGTAGSFEETGDIYRSKVNTNTGHQPDVSDTQWEMVSHDNSDFYNEFTICFNEFKNKFTTFYEFKPRLYLQWKNTYFSSHPKSLYRDEIYLHNKGNELTWYNNGIVSQTDEGYIEMVVNKDPNVAKTFYDLMFNCEIKPYRVELFTKNHESYLLEPEFTNREEQFISYIKNDILTSTNGSDNSQVTSRMWGQYLKVRFYFETGEYNKLFNFIAGYRNNHRTHI